MSIIPVVPADAAPGLAKLVEIMARLRDPNGGCAWDLEQSFATIAPYTIEEAYEVADAIARGDMAALVDELGDLQLQVVFHARIAEEAGLFTLADIFEAIAAKMIRRHPHIFAAGDNDTAAIRANWEAIKDQERAGHPDASALAGVTVALPALSRAEKLQRRAARTGFDWPDASGARGKIIEELGEVDAATDDAHRAEEIGDLLFTAVNLARHHGVDAEAALRAANAKFERRFRAMEARDPDFAALPLADKDRLWHAVKRNEKQTGA